MPRPGVRPTFRGIMATTQDEDLDGAPFEGDRPGAHPVDLLGELPIDGELTRESQLMTDADLDPREVQGDRFDVGDDDLGMQPDLEADPDAPDLKPDTVRRFAEAEEEADPDDIEDGLGARPMDEPVDEVPVEPADEDDLS